MAAVSPKGSIIVLGGESIKYITAKLLNVNENKGGADQGPFLFAVYIKETASVPC